MVIDLPFHSHEEFITKIREPWTSKQHHHISRNQIPCIRDPSESFKHVSLNGYFYPLNNTSWFKSNGGKVSMYFSFLLSCFLLSFLLTSSLNWYSNEQLFKNCSSQISVSQIIPPVMRHLAHKYCSHTSFSWRTTNPSRSKKKKKKKSIRKGRLPQVSKYVMFQSHYLIGHFR